MTINMKFIGELHQSDEFSWESGGVNIPALFNIKWYFVFEDFDRYERNGRISRSY